VTRALGRLALALLPMLAACTARLEPRGAISGTVGFPGEEVPPLRIYALAEDGISHYSVTTPAGLQAFTITGVPPGRYVVVAYPTTADAAGAGAGGWSRFVECGMTVACKDHSLVPVVVTAGQTTGGVNVADWYADPGSFPKKPAQ
jgi:hypothetical protein